MKALTIFTPAFNRAHTLSRTYLSWFLYSILGISINEVSHMENQWRTENGFGINGQFWFHFNDVVNRKIV